MKIYNSIMGNIECEKHAPFKGSDTWVWDQYQEMTLEEQEEFRHSVGLPDDAPICEECDVDRYTRQ